MRQIVGKGRYLTSWVTSGLSEEPFDAPMVELHLDNYRTGVTAMRDIYDNYQVSQIKRQFLDRGRFFRCSYPLDVSFDRIWLSDGSSMVDFSGFWFYPTEITVYAKLYIESDRERKIPLSLRCNGSMIAWINGKESFRVLSEAVNYDTVKDVENPRFLMVVVPRRDNSQPLPTVKKLSECSLRLRWPDGRENTIAFDHLASPTVQ